MNLIKYSITVINLLLIFLLIFIYYKKNTKNNLSEKSIIDFFMKLNNKLKYQKTVPIKSKSYGKKNNYYLYSPVLVQKKNSIMI